MKRLIFILGWLGAAAMAAAAPEFLPNLSPAEKTAAGLQKLTPAELARLAALVERYKAGGLTPTAPVAAERAAERQPSAAPGAVQPGATRAMVAPEPVAPKQAPGWLTRLKNAAAAGDDKEALESRLAGEFTGWAGQTVFTLADGTRWQQANPGEYTTPPLASPKVRVTPAALGGFWLEVEGVRQRLRVVPYGVK